MFLVSAARFQPDFLQAALSSSKSDSSTPSSGSSMSSIISMNNNGLMTLSCGVPFWSSYEFDMAAPTRTCMLRFERKSTTELATLPFKPFGVILLQRVGIARYASAVYATAMSVCPSVCPSSVTRRYCVETNEATIMRFTPTGKTFILVSFILVSGEVKVVWKFARDHP